MNLGDINYKVWEVKALKRAGQEEAKKILERVAKQVQPIMRKRKWRVKVLSEFYTRRLLGLNVGAGVHVKLQLRKINRDWEFLPFEQVLDTMLHELCHNVHGPHNAKFYKLWDELRQECAELMFKGITGTGEGFDLPGRCLGGISSQPPLSSLRQTALAAAEKRVHLGSLLPSGPKRLGGNRSIMADLSPIQAAAMAAERRLQDDIWCGSQSSAIEESSSDILEDIDLGRITEDLKSCSCPSVNTLDTISRKRNRESSNSLDSNFVDLDADTSTSGSILNHESKTQKSCKPCRTSVPQSEGHLDSGFVELPNTSASASVGNCVAIHSPEEPGMWECEACTFLNNPLFPTCEICSTPRPKDKSIWTCKFCTLENSVKLDKCEACDQWRYSHGAPVSTRAPYVGT